MRHDTGDTIAALSTAPGAAALGVVRVSGPASREILARVVPSAAGARPRAVRAGAAVDPSTGERLDRVLCFFLDAPRSSTGEEMAELQGHGGARNMARLLDAVLAAGARPARPGEFTLRAFLNGKLDLVQAEAVAAVVAARSDGALRAAQAQLAGGLSREAAAVREPLVRLLGRMEASMDFPDDVDEPADGAAALAAAERRLALLAASWARGRRLAEGVRVVLAGRPNVGKSSLLNALLGRRRSIVDDEPGTTRDVVEAAAELGGFPVTLVDTAGLREGGGRVEAAGIEMTREALRGADVVLLVMDDRETGDAALDGFLAGAAGSAVVPVLNKEDLGWAPPPRVASLVAPLGPIATSCVSGKGIEALAARIARVAGGEVDPAAPVLASARHLRCVEEALGAVREAARREAAAEPLDLRAACVREAASALDELTGREAPADVLDEIFSRFCIGK